MPKKLDVESYNFKNIILIFLIFSPVFFIALESFYRQDMYRYFQEQNIHNYEYLYFSARAFLIFLFVLMLSTIPLKNFPVTASVDIFSTERAKNDPLLGLRGLACLNVFFGHWFLVVCSPAGPALQTWDYIVRMGVSFSPWCGVWMFFTLSGYLMTKGFVSGRHTVDNKGLTRYYRNRILRIFPVYFFVIFSVAAIFKPASLNLFNKESLVRMLEAVFFDQQGGGVIGAYWSVSTEFQFYLIAPAVFILLMSFFKKAKYFILFLIAFLIIFCIGKTLILAYHPEKWHPYVYLPLFGNLDCFISGSVTAILADKMRRNCIYIDNGINYGIFLTIIAQVIFSAWSYPEMALYPGQPGPHSQLYYLAFAPSVTAALTAIIIFLFDLSKRERVKYKNIWGISSFFGLITYCLYSIHEPVILFLNKAASCHVDIFNSLMLMPATLIVCVLLAFPLYVLVEKKFDRLRKWADGKSYSS